MSKERGIAKSCVSGFVYIQEIRNVLSVEPYNGKIQSW